MYERQGSGYDSDARGYELQGRNAAPSLIRLSFLDRILPWRWQKRAQYYWQQALMKQMADDIMHMPLKVYRDGKIVEADPSDRFWQL